MRILFELVIIPQIQESIGCCITFPDFFIFFIEQLFLIFNQMLSIRAFGRRDEEHATANSLSAADLCKQFGTRSGPTQPPV